MRKVFYAVNAAANNVKRMRLPFAQWKHATKLFAHMKMVIALCVINMSADKGFRHWFLQRVLAKAESNETAILKKERDLRIAEEERVRTRCRRCGYSTIAWLLSGLYLCSAFLGAVFASIVIVAFTVMTLGTTAFLSCAWNPPKDQCLFFQVQNTTAHVKWSSESIWNTIEYVTAWQECNSIFFEEIFGKTGFFTTWKRIQPQVCRVVAKTGLNDWHRWAGVYKI
jgi:hypothetical protein